MRFKGLDLIDRVPDELWMEFLYFQYEVNIQGMRAEGKKKPVAVSSGRSHLSDLPAAQNETTGPNQHEAGALTPPPCTVYSEARNFHGICFTALDRKSVV